MRFGHLSDIDDDAAWVPGKTREGNENKKIPAEPPGCIPLYGTLRLSNLAGGQNLEAVLEPILSGDEDPSLGSEPPQRPKLIDMEELGNEDNEEMVAEGGA